LDLLDAEDGEETEDEEELDEKMGQGIPMETEMILPSGPMQSLCVKPRLEDRELTEEELDD